MTSRSPATAAPTPSSGWEHYWPSPHVSCDSLGLESRAGRKLCWTMQHYGGYWTDDSAWQANYIKTEAHTEDYRLLTREDVRRDLGRVIAAAQVVANNGPDNIGGGGTPLAPRHVNAWAPGVFGTESGAGGVPMAAGAVSPHRIRGTSSTELVAADPVRVLDSRPVGRRGAGSVTPVDVGPVGVPGGASAVLLNVTAVNAAEPGFVTVFPCGGAPPLASNLNFTSCRSSRCCAPSSTATPAGAWQPCWSPPRRSLPPTPTVSRRRARSATSPWARSSRAWTGCGTPSATPGAELGQDVPAPPATSHPATLGRMRSDQASQSASWSSPIWCW